MLNAAVIGLGVIAPRHISVIQSLPGVRLAAVCDCNESMRAAAPSGVPFYSDMRRMLDEVRPDVVHICLPHALHFPAAELAAEFGCHVFCEKPPALDGAEVERFVELERCHPELKFGICFQNRRNETIRCLKEILDGGRFGSVTAVKGVMLWRRDSEYYSEKPWRGSMSQAGGGCLTNQAIHTLDLMSYLGGRVSSLRAITGQLLGFDIEVEDTAMARMTYESGAAGLFVATVANSQDEFLQIGVRTEQAEFRIEHETLSRVFDDRSTEVLARDVHFREGKAYYGNGHHQLISEFYHAIETDGCNYIHVRDAADSMRLVSAIQRSAALGDAVAITRINT